MDLLIVNFKVADSKKELSMRSLANIGEYIGDCKRDDTRAGSGTLHRKRFSGSCHTIGKDCAVVTLHDSSDQALSRGIIHLCVVIVRGKYVIYPLVSQRFSAFYIETHHNGNRRPLSHGKRRATFSHLPSTLLRREKGLGQKHQGERER